MLRNQKFLIFYKKIFRIRIEKNPGNYQDIKMAENLMEKMTKKNCQIDTIEIIRNSYVSRNSLFSGR